ncbi:ABC transporter substrate-binding protein [Arthrospiribacter ruber]|uniref:Amino acid ABC transporter substrate-binding protein n=1 Tax=Arthrospiribacter ruber TaxID=2487934 RepID=A0A951J596_9BACT|nr:ABC transporter substrate-binding protein [Arthrospiribacter ruber]MBW3469908.1 amino acid ABC transporter substrate-binding protein [Arthrospiribacter ruber]
MKRVFLLLLFLVSFFASSSAQDKLSEYKRAKTLIGYGNYKDAMDLLQPFLDKSSFGQLSNYASYHYAFAAYQNGQFELTRNTLQPLVERRAWNKSEDAKYLLALSYFQEKKYKEALETASSISDSKLRQEVANASFEFLKDAPLDFLMGNVKKFNDNSGYMLALKSQLDRKTIFSSEEREVYAEINRSGDIGSLVDKNGEVLDIALVLPFNYSGASGVRNLGSGNFVFELYRGILLGVEELRKNGVKVNLKTFDTARDNEKVESILNDPFLRQADVIVGPIYPEEVEIVSNFAETSKIPFINPLSNVDDKLQGMQYAYLFRPSVSAITDGVVEFARKNIPGKKIALAYSSALRDETLAKQIQEEGRKFGFDIIRSENVNGRSVIDFFKNLHLNGENNSSADLVILLTDDPNIGSSALGFLESQNISTPILVMDSWLYFNFANFEMIKAENFHFIGNNTLRLGDKRVTSFRDKYYSNYTAYPTFNTHLGYELAQWIGSAINSKDGFDLRANLDKKGFWDGVVTYGLDFKNSSSNKFVPVLKLEKGKVEIK